MSATGSLTSAVTTEATTRANQVSGLHAQLVFKTVATRGDGKKILGAIGLASTAPNDSTGGQSEIILQADRLVFVSSSAPDAPLKNLLEVGQVNGVTTLRIPAAIIGDLTVGTAKIIDLAVNTGKLADNAATITSGVVLATNTGVTQGGYNQLIGLNTDTGGKPLLILASAKLFADIGSFSYSLELRVNGAAVGGFGNDFPYNGTINTGLFAIYVPNPPAGNLSVQMWGTCDGAPVGVLANGNSTFMYTLGTKK